MQFLHGWMKNIDRVNNSFLSVQYVQTGLESKVLHFLLPHQPKSSYIIM